MKLTIISALYISGALSAVTESDYRKVHHHDVPRRNCDCSLIMQNGNKIHTDVPPGLGNVVLGNAQVYSWNGVPLNKCAISLFRTKDCKDYRTGDTCPTGPNCDLILAYK
ncbi:uncharacterized protein RAG0_11869 [Rhynchosporium agropyri]|uniref:Uncharacterized protein n=1 Tax=Rhynchosporium agropyri TaxID=914238 RepID=A0A1E1L6F3_9HELO|nr:uncharacterized protein RAG0_11869 [Rhynchosporium agropyri]